MGGFCPLFSTPLHPSHIEYSISIDADLKTSGNASVYFFRSLQFLYTHPKKSGRTLWHLFTHFERTARPSTGEIGHGKQSFPEFYCFLPLTLPPLIKGSNSRYAMQFGRWQHGPTVAERFNFIAGTSFFFFLSFLLFFKVSAEKEKNEEDKEEEVYKR